MAKTITVRCNTCGKRFKAPAKLAGQQARCPCGEIIEVPADIQRDKPEQPRGEAWFYLDDGERTGPVSQKKLTEMLKNGNLAPDNPVWTHGMDEWKSADEVNALKVGDETSHDTHDTEKQEPSGTRAVDTQEKKTVKTDQKAKDDAQIDDASSAASTHDEGSAKTSATGPKADRPEEDARNDDDRPVQPATRKKKKDQSNRKGAGPQLIWPRIMMYALIALGGLSLLGSLTGGIYGFITGTQIAPVPRLPVILAGSGLVLLTWSAIIWVGCSLARAMWAQNQR
ncbi:MAG: DUF4339 domain-containing protein [Planctomycetota bacterium]